jgi:hypothetical protein
MFEAVAVAQSMSRDVAMAQIATAVTTIFYSLVFAIGYYLVVRGNRAMLIEMRRENRSGGGPQILVEADYGRLPSIDLVVRNVSGGSARDITFEFSAPVEDLKGFVVSDLPYPKRGVDFLGPGSHVACFWDDLEPLVASLRGKGLDEGISVTVKYRDLTGESYETRWTINPLLYEGNRHVPREGLGDVVSAPEKLHETLSREAVAPMAADGGGERQDARPGARPG